MKLFNRHKKQVLENNYQEAKSELSPKAKRRKIFSEFGGVI